MVCFPHAKINLGLKIVSEREDGFHNIITALYPIDYCDVLEIIPSREFNFVQTGISFDGNPEDNLVVRAYRLLNEITGLPEVNIHLHKNIPAGAGLGGGSSDAAYTLKTLNTLFALEIDDHELEDYARRLGSDCAFFIKGDPCLATGKGDILEPLAVDLSNYQLVVITPALSISTAAAYEGVTLSSEGADLRQSLEEPISQWAGLVENDFEKSIFEGYPRLGEIKNVLLDQGAIFSSLSGTGSSVFGIFERKTPTKLEFPKDYRVWGKII